MPATPTSAKALREERHKIVVEARKILDKADAEKREPTAEERQQWDKFMGRTGDDGKYVPGDADRLKERIDIVERQETVEKEIDAAIDRSNLPVNGRAKGAGSDGA